LDPPTPVIASEPPTATPAPEVSYAALAAQYSIRLSAMLLLSRYYNPGRVGFKRAIEDWKFELTEQEIRDSFTGLISFPVEGWYRDEITRKEYSDELFRYEIDFYPNTETPIFLKSWKRTLEERFEQSEIYVRLGIGLFLRSQ
jgi:hypothetical protein